MLKKTTLAVIGMAASGFAFAGAMGPVCTPGSATVPCEVKQWDFGVQALYLRTIYSANKGYQTTTTGIEEVSNNWDWGFHAEGSYHFNTGNDIVVDWTHYSSANSQLGFSGFLPVPGFEDTALPFDVANQNRLDQVNVVMGQRADFGLVNKMRLYAGLQYANIQSNITNFFPIGLVTVFGPVTSIDQFDNTDYKGVGPVAGIDYAYDITPALSITANGSGSILYGTGRYDMGYVVQTSGLVAASVYGTKKIVVPSLAAKVGLNYAYNIAQGVFNFEGGFQAINYFNALQTQNLQNITLPIHSVNYGLYGPYMGVKYVGNA